MITIVDLNYARMEAPFLSSELLVKMRETIEKNEKVLLFFNRRSSAKALVCRDCGYRAMCRHCDISLSLHTSPTHHLLCHHCNAEEPVPAHCPKCHGSNLAPVGAGIQRIEEEIVKRFSAYQTVRLDSDKKRSEGLKLSEIKSGHILISTELGNTLSIDGIGLVAFILLETETTIPEYDIEERIYTNIAYNMRRWSEVLIQTYVPKSDLVRHLVDGNYRDFLVHTLTERKSFRYPPYSELVHVTVRDESIERVKDIIYKLKNKLELLKSPDIELYFDRELFSRRAGEYIQKIVLKGTNLEPLLAQISGEVFRNRGVNVEWK